MYLTAGTRTAAQCPSLQPLQVESLGGSVELESFEIERLRRRGLMHTDSAMRELINNNAGK